MPLAIWVMRGFIMSIPEELEHAARIDGATRFGAMVRVVLPLAAPGLATTAVLAFLEGWKEFLLALTFINERGRARPCRWCCRPSSGAATPTGAR